MTWGLDVFITVFHSEPASALSLLTVRSLQTETSLQRNPGMTRCLEKSNLGLSIRSKYSQQCHEGQKRHLRRPHFSKRLPKLAILPDYKCPRMLCLPLPARRKVRKLDFQSEFSISKIIRIFLNFFSLKNNRLGAHFLLR